MATTMLQTSMANANWGCLVDNLKNAGVWSQAPPKQPQNSPLYDTRTQSKFLC
jgi:hypothetical protein